MLFESLVFDDLVKEIERFSISDAPDGVFRFIWQAGAASDTSKYTAYSPTSEVPYSSLGQLGSSLIGNSLTRIDDAMLVSKIGHKGVEVEIIDASSVSAFSYIQQLGLQFVDFHLKQGNASPWTAHQESIEEKLFSVGGMYKLLGLLDEAILNAGYHGNGYYADQEEFDPNSWEEAYVTVYPYFGAKGVVYVIQDEGKGRPFDIRALLDRQLNQNGRYSTRNIGVENEELSQVLSGNGTSRLNSSDHVKAAYRRLDTGGTELVLQFLYLD